MDHDVIKNLHLVFQFRWRIYNLIVFQSSHPYSNCRSKRCVFVSWRPDHKLAWQYALKDGFHGGTNFDTFFFAFYCQSLSNTRFLNRKYEQFYFPAKSKGTAYSDQNTINCIDTLRFLKNVWGTCASEYIMSRRVLTLLSGIIEARASSWLSFSRFKLRSQRPLLIVTSARSLCWWPPFDQ